MADFSSSFTTLISNIPTTTYAKALAFATILFIITILNNSHNVRIKWGCFNATMYVKLAKNLNNSSLTINQLTKKIQFN